MLRARTWAIIAGLAVAAFAAYVILDYNDAFAVWDRDEPLRNPIAVKSVGDGKVTLADGRVFRPAGVRQATGVDAAEYDRALRVICAQGVEVIRDLGDGRAFLLAEPKFFNWCGTSQSRWAGSYYQCPVSELLVLAAYSTPELDQAGLTEHERRRLEGVKHIGIQRTPLRVSSRSDALKYNADVRWFSKYDTTLELMTDEPP